MKITLDFDKIAKEPGLTLSDVVYLSSLKTKDPDVAFQVITLLGSEINYAYLEQAEYITVVNKDYSKAKLNVTLDNFVKINSKAQKEHLVLFDEYFNLFPHGTFNGRLLRSEKKASYNKFVEFLREYPEYEPCVIKATQKAITEAKAKAFQFMQNSSNFIRKDKESALAAYCDAVLNNAEVKSFTGGTGLNKFI
jgi:hypothetical protein